jgi:hypothetical protein
VRWLANDDALGQALFVTNLFGIIINLFGIAG